MEKDCQARKLNEDDAFWYRPTPGSPGQKAIKRLCVYSMIFITFVVLILFLVSTLRRVDRSRVYRQIGRLSLLRWAG